LECIENCNLHPDECQKTYVAADNFYGVSYFLAIILGFTMIVSQGVDFVQLLVPQSWLDGNGSVQRFVLPGTVRQERSGTQAASFRMKQFLQHALDISHSKTLISNSNKLANNKLERKTTVLERFLLLPRKAEKVGGVFWAWKKMWNGTAFTEEGIWFSSRLLACNFAQVIVFGVMIFFTRVVYYKQNNFFYSDEERERQANYGNTTDILYGNYTEILGDDYFNF
jgi:hypothetical protein